MPILVLERSPSKIERKVGAMRLQLTTPFLVLSFLLFSNNCFAADAGDYFPLKEGITWIYKVASDKSETRKLTITNLAAREINARTVTPQRWEIMETRIYYLIARDDSGIYRYGEQKSEKGAPTVTKPKLYHLKNPVDLGTTWDVKTKLGDDQVIINLTIESLTDAVRVPAGNFDNCVKIKQEGKGQEKGDAVLAITAYEWYAPDVGLVKSMVSLKKKVKNDLKFSENLTYRLESLKK